MKKTIILGAGASVDLDYPTGEELMKIVKGCFLSPKPRTSQLFIKSGNHRQASQKKLVSYLDYLQPTLDELQIPQNDIDLFGKLILHSHAPSIDIFLEKENNSIFNTIGKLFISLILMHHEGPQKNSWYDLILRKFYTHEKDFDFSGINFITFNYDRSLESILFEYIFQYYKLKIIDSENQAYQMAKQMFKTLKFIHMYGSFAPTIFDYLDQYENYKNNYTQYGTYRNQVELNNPFIDLKLTDSLKRINTIFGGNFDDQKERLIFETLKESSEIYFIGLGFHDLNMDSLMKFKHFSGEINWFDSNKKYYVCSHGLSISRRNEISKRIPLVIFSPPEVKAYEFFQQYIL